MLAMSPDRQYLFKALFPTFNYFCLAALARFIPSVSNHRKTGRSSSQTPNNSRKDDLPLHSWEIVLYSGRRSVHLLGFGLLTQSWRRSFSQHSIGAVTEDAFYAFSG